ncbi:calpain-A-like isoform X3 [Artemia franciscana]|uniref:calpain-A-like isoform X3 n=1 Tax=Artemia franciscana TaxID=6661 RepID=UPI0032D9D4F1
MFGGLIKSVGKSLVKQGLDIVNETLDKTLNQGGGGADANSGLQSSIPIPGLPGLKITGLSSALESFGGGAAGFGFGGLLGGLIQNVIASSGGGEGGEGGLLDSLTKLVVEKAGPTVLPPSFNYNRGKVDVCYLGHTHKACPVMLIDEHARPIPGKSKSSPQDYEKIKEDCLAEGKLFEDPSFPAEDCSLFYSKRPFRRFRWLRPHEICSDPQFVVDDASRFDIQQGELGDCWLLAAMANLTINPVLFKRIVPDDQSFDDGEYAGIFHFRFWQYGQWVDVVIDDKLPTYNGKLVYLQSQEKNEFWSALLEKAYAKLHGSYEALKGGTTSEAMEDFTGGVAEMYELNNADMSLFKIMVKSFERSSLMSCAIEPDPNVVEAETAVGLIKGHAYSITDVRLISIQTPRVSGKIPMVRIRNPWGNEAEWNGAWSDKSPEWQYIPDEEKESIGLTFNTDGEFWMSFKDYKKYFSRMEIVHLSPEIYDEVVEDEECKKKWELNSFEGAWVRGATAGGCRNNLQTFWTNPQFRMTLEDCDEDEDDKCTLIVSLMQKNRRSQRKAGLDLLTIGFAIYAINDPDNAPKPLDVRFFKYNASVARSPAFINLREVCARFKLPPGTYCLVPSTFDRGEEGEFIIRVFTEKSNSMQENDAELGYDDSGEQTTLFWTRRLPTRQELLAAFAARTIAVFKHSEKPQDLPLTKFGDPQPAVIPNRIVMGNSLAGFMIFERDDINWRVEVPEKSLLKLLRDLHLSQNHLAVNEMYQRVKTYVVAPGINQMIRQVVKECKCKIWKGDSLHTNHLASHQKGNLAMVNHNSPPPTPKLGSSGLKYISPENLSNPKKHLPSRQEGNGAMVGRNLPPASIPDLSRPRYNPPKQPSRGNIQTREQMKGPFHPPSNFLQMTTSQPSALNRAVTPLSSRPTGTRDSRYSILPGPPSATTVVPHSLTGSIPYHDSRQRVPYSYPSYSGMPTAPHALQSNLQAPPKKNDRGRGHLPRY